MTTKRTSPAARLRAAKAQATRQAFQAALARAEIPAAECEVTFHPTRRWRWDYAWPEHRVALEVHGGLYVAGHHSRGASQEGDFEKTNAAAELGWRVLHCVPRKLTHAATLETIRRALGLTIANEG